MVFSFFMQMFAKTHTQYEHCEYPNHPTGFLYMKKIVAWKDGNGTQIHMIGS